MPRYQKWTCKLLMLLKGIKPLVHSPETVVILKDNVDWIFCHHYHLLRQVCQWKAGWDYPELITQRSPHGCLRWVPESCIAVCLEDTFKGETLELHPVDKQEAAKTLTLRSKPDRLTVSSSFSLRFLFCRNKRIQIGYSYKSVENSNNTLEATFWYKCNAQNIGTF